MLQPNVLLNLLHDHVVMHWLIPNGPGRTVIMCDWLFDPQVMARADFDPMDAVEIFDVVNRQDWEVCELTQLSMGSKAYRSVGCMCLRSGISGLLLILCWRGSGR